MYKQLLLRNMWRRSYSTPLPSYALKPAFGPGNKIAAESFKQSLNATKTHAAKTSKFWAKVGLTVALPCIFLTAINTYFVEKEHADHRKHLALVNDDEWPTQYEFQNIRSKPFFWGDGDKTLFWNPIVNRHIKD